jgi:hypothetical protein
MRSVVQGWHSITRFRRSGFLRTWQQSEINITHPREYRLCGKRGDQSETCLSFHLVVRFNSRSYMHCRQMAETPRTGGKMYMFPLLDGECSIFRCH